jgi:ABC-type transport system involved in multi-copper enzyme maturation permease subunit
MKFFSIAKNTFLEAIRSRLLHSVLFFSGFIILVSALFGSVSIGEQFRVVKSFGYTMISLSGMVCTILAGVSLFQKEIKQKTIYNILSKPVSRTEFLFGKLIGLILTSWVLIILMMIALMLFVSPMEGRFDLLSFQALYVMCLELVIIAGLTLFFSSLATTPVLPGIFTFSTYLAGKSIHYLGYFLSNPESSVILQRGIKVVKLMLPDLKMLTPYDQLLYGFPLGGFEMSLLLIYSVSYTSVLFVLSSAIFKYREL